MGVAYPDLYAAVGVHSGLACGAARDIPRPSPPCVEVARGLRGETPARRVPMAGGSSRPSCSTRIAITTVHPVNGDHVMAQAGAGAGGLRTTVEHGQVPGGHASPYLHSGPDGEDGAGTVGRSRRRPCVGRRESRWVLHRPEGPPTHPVGWSGSSSNTRALARCVEPEIGWARRPGAGRVVVGWLDHQRGGAQDDGTVGLGLCTRDDGDGSPVQALVNRSAR